MTAFEKGYYDFLHGVGQDGNPFDADTAPFSLQRWVMGWARAKRDRK
jgi:ribosome modulation factor